MYTIEHTEHKGAGLVADGKIRAGDAVLVEEPYEASLNSDEACKRSHLTFKTSSNLQRCSGCKSAWYSSLVGHALVLFHFPASEFAEDPFDGHMLIDLMHECSDAMNW